MSDYVGYYPASASPMYSDDDCELFNSAAVIRKRVPDKAADVGAVELEDVILQGQCDHHPTETPGDADDFDDLCPDDQPLLPSSTYIQQGVHAFNECSSDSVSNSTQSDVYTAETALEQLGIGRFQLKMFFLCGMFSATDALEMMLLSVLSPELRCEWLLENWQIALITTIVFVGMLAGSNLWGSYADKYGRRPIMILAACWIGYYGFLTSQSPNFIWIVVLRGLVGFGFGGAIQAFTLLSEYLPSKYRAKLLIIYNVLWASGSSFEILMAYIIIPRFGWRLLVFVSALPMFLTFLASFAIPESLRYLLAAGQQEKAEAILRGIATANRTQVPRGTFVQSTPVVRRGRFSDLLNSDYRRTVLLLWLTWFGVACVYYGIILAQSEILEMGGACGSKGVTDDDCHCKRHGSSDYISMIVATFGEFAAIPFNLLTIDRLGRKWTLGLNYVVAGLFCLLAQICTDSAILVTIFFFGVRSSISGVFNVIYIYTVEVLPTTVRSIGLGSCSGAARLGALITPFVAQVILAHSVRLGLNFYAILCLFCSVAVYFLPIETKGRALQQTHVSEATR